MPDFQSFYFDCVEISLGIFEYFQSELPHDWGNKHPLASYDLGYRPGPRVLTHSHSTMNWDSVEFDIASFDLISERDLRGRISGD